MSPTGKKNLLKIQTYGGSTTHFWINKKSNKILIKNKNMHRNDENENKTTQNLWNSVKAVLRGRFIAIQAYLNKQERNKMNNLTLHLKQL